MANFISDDKWDLAVNLFSEGKSLREVSKIVGIAKATAGKIRQSLLDAAEHLGESPEFQKRKGGYWDHRKHLAKNMSESKSPCIGCDFEHEDKNGEQCTNCERRIKYAEDEFMIPNEALEADLAAQEETRKIREMKPRGAKRGPKPKAPTGTVTMEEVEEAHREQLTDITETRMAIDVADLKAGDSSEKKRGPKPKKLLDETKQITVKTPEEKNLCRKCEEKPAMAKGLCDLCYSQAYYAERKKQTKGSGCLHLEFFTVDGDRLYLFKDLERIAKEDMRPIAVQALYFIKQGIEKWKKEHEPPR